MIEKFFKLKEHGTNVYTEVLAGLTIFATAAYVLAVVPSMLAGSLNRESVFLAVCLGSGFLTIIMGFVANLPVLMAPGLGITAYFAIVSNQNGGIGNDAAFFGLLLAGILLFILTITKTRQTLFDSIPVCLKNALMAGIGLFIVMIGLKVSNIIIVDAHIGKHTLDLLQSTGGHVWLQSLEWNLSLGNVKQPDVMLTLIGLLTTTVLIMFNIRSAILIGLIVTTIIGIPLGLTNIHNINFGLPNISHINFFDFQVLSKNLANVFNTSVLAVSCVFIFIGLMDNSTNLMTITSQVGDHLKTENEKKRAMLVDSLGISLASFLGIPFFVYYLESLAGISVGGKTGLTALVVGLLFFISLILSPIFLAIPTAATAPALVIVGISVLSNVIKQLNFNDFSESFPSFLSMALMPLTCNIADSISGGVIFYIILKLFQRKTEDVHLSMYIFALLIILRYVFL